MTGRPELAKEIPLHGKKLIYYYLLFSIVVLLIVLWLSTMGDHPQSEGRQGAPTLSIHAGDRGSDFMD
ncbi:MAG: hypothetical protein R3E79_09535 [Caldilineaceae bacterium]